MCFGLHVKYPLFPSDYNQIWIFLDRFSKNHQVQNFMEIRLVGAELFHADWRIDMTNKVVAFRSFVTAPD